jgi:hypothetical protein
VLASLSLTFLRAAGQARRHRDEPVIYAANGREVLLDPLLVGSQAKFEVWKFWLSSAWS